MEVAHKVKQFKCKNCDFSCLSSEQLFEHVVKNHGPPPKKQLYKCQVCIGVEFESDILLKSHIASVHTMKIKCKNCEFRCISSEQLLEHNVKNHSPPKPQNPLDHFLLKVINVMVIESVL